jgi:hypothetical protein
MAETGISPDQRKAALHTGRSLLISLDRGGSKIYAIIMEILI